MPPSAIITFAAALVTLWTLAVAQPGVPPRAEELATLSTASYPLFPLDGSGVRGQLQVVSRVEGGSVLILTVDGIEPGVDYSAAVYVGDCGPDRDVLLELEPVGRINDPYVSITETDLTFEAITGGDHFAYVFLGDTIERPETLGLDVPALACGEVGLGAI
jgi:hypothetical protein